MRGIFKKSAISLAILGFASSAFAGTITGAFFGVEGLDLQARNGDLDFITVAPSTSVGTINTYAIHPSYSWDWRIFGGLDFCGNEDMTVSWLHYQTNNHNDFGTQTDASGDINTSILRWFDADSWAATYSNLGVKIDDVYGVYGHRLHVGAWTLRFAGGIEWFQLKDNHYNQGAVPGSGLQPNNVEVWYQANDTTRGVGPRVEFDFNYNMPYNLYAFTRTSLALLISTRTINLTTDTDFDLPSWDFSKRRVVIPKLGIKMGLGFSYAPGAIGGEGAGFGLFNSNVISLEAGWQTETYIHAVERPSGWDNTNINSPSVGATSNAKTRLSNLGLDGLFIGAKLNMNWL